MLVFCAVACNRPYSLDLDLAVSRNDIKVSASAGKDYFVVYSTGSWTIDMEPESAGWVRLSDVSGRKEKVVYVMFDENPSVSRAVTFTVTSGDRTCTVYLAQEGAAGEYVYTVLEPAVTVLSGARTFRLHAVTTLPSSVLDRVAVSVDHAGQEPWISGVSATADALQFDVAAWSGEDRSAVISMDFPVARWDTPVTASVIVTQVGASPSLTAPDTVAAAPEGDEPFRLDLSSNVRTELYDDWTFGYGLSDSSWLTDLSFDPAALVFRATPLVNHSGAARSTVVTFRITDGDGRTVAQASTVVTQEESETRTLPGGDVDEQPYDPEVEF